MNCKPNTVVQFCYSNMKGRKMRLSVNVTEFTTVPSIIVPVSGLRIMLSSHFSLYSWSPVYVTGFIHILSVLGGCIRWSSNSCVSTVCKSSECVIQF